MISHNCLGGNGNYLGTIFNQIDRQLLRRFLVKKNLKRNSSSIASSCSLNDEEICKISKDCARTILKDVYGNNSQFSFNVNDVEESLKLFNDRQHLPSVNLKQIQNLSYIIGSRPSVRTFKTHRSNRRPSLNDEIIDDYLPRQTNNSTLRNDNINMPLLQRLLQRRATKVPKEVEISNKLVQDYLKSTKSKDNNKLSFADGYVAGTSSVLATTTTQREKMTWNRIIRFTIFYLFITWMIITIVSFLSGGGGGVKGGLSSALSMTQQFEANPEEVNVKFSDVKGVEEAKDELIDIVAYLQDPQKFTRLGARLPKGVLLVGQPGIGKTLLARAVAGEANVPFFQASGSEFDEMFVGTGARRVRQLFDAAKQRAPCVIFIDEIDSVGAKRTNSQLHPYANQTINQLLSEMDGFEKNEGIIVLAATNKRDNLDKALLRPGRFDIEVRVHTPDLKGRVEILDLYLNKISHDLTSDQVYYLARGTTGFTGADLENVVNQAALNAATTDATRVTMKHMEWARDKVLMGPEKKSKIPDNDTNRVTAYHEAGHTIVSFFTKSAQPLHKVTIIPRGQALGYTASIPEKELYNQTKIQLLAEMDVCMGGRAAEELTFGVDQITTGASSDFQKATQIATAMVKRFGMSEKVGKRVFRDEEMDAGLGFITVNEISSDTQALIDSEIQRLLQESYSRALEILKRHTNELKSLSETLLIVETLDKNEISSILKRETNTPAMLKIHRRVKEMEKMDELEDKRTEFKLPISIDSL
ncbi:hypothetical protein SNEBB_009831 [Seison nebaliae]|nr:hypothetical protein SNEBB_009831 [Seison nebaliae]